MANYRIDPSKFALACVESSSPELSVEEKLELYKDAYAKSFAFYQQVQNKLDTQEQEDRDASVKNMSEYFRTHGMP